MAKFMWYLTENMNGGVTDANRIKLQVVKSNFKISKCKIQTPSNFKEGSQQFRLKKKKKKLQNNNGLIGQTLVKYPAKRVASAGSIDAIKIITTYP